MLQTESEADLEVNSEHEKVREARLRRKAVRQGFWLRKSRRRDPQAMDYGQFLVVDPDTNTISAWNAYGGEWMSLDEVEEFLALPWAE